jgi:hypothetical protein
MDYIRAKISESKQRENLFCLVFAKDQEKASPAKTPELTRALGMILILIPP